MATLLVCGICWCNRTAQADTIYNNSVNDLSYKLDPGTLEVGDQVVLAGTARYLTNFTCEYWGTSLSSTFAGDVEMCVRFYLNNGTPFNGYATPGTKFYDSGWFSIQPTSRSVLKFVAGPQFSPTGLLIPANEMTWSVQIRGLGLGDAAGVDLYGPIAAGLGWPDYWVRRQTGWQLETNQNTVINFAATMEASPTATMAQPPLMISRLPGKSVVSWPLWADAFNLQISPDVVGSPWTTITSGIYVSGDNYVWTNSVPGTKGFFRLRYTAP